MATSLVGVDVGGTSIRAVRFDGDLQPAATSAGPTPSTKADDVDAIVATIAHHVLTIDAGATAVGVGVPGRVDVARGVVTSAFNLGIHAPVPLGDLLEARLGARVHLENDVNAAALGAFHHLGLGPASSLAYVNVGTGIAAGFVLGGALWRGASGGAGEIGHLPMWSHGPACACGQAGCAEAVGSGRAVSADGERREDVAAAVAWAIQLCVMTLDVEVVALGGGMTESPAIVAAVRATLAERETASPMLGDIGLARRIAVVPANAPLGSLGAVLALAGRDAGAAA